jgi:hypothetical protein
MFDNILPRGEEDRSTKSVQSMPLCAWCLSEQGIPAGEGSHGICKEHASQLLLQQRKLHRRIGTRS